MTPASDRAHLAADLAAVTWITDRVAVTNHVSARDPTILAEHRIQAVLCLDADVFGQADGYPGTADVRLVHLHDGDNPIELFERAVRELRWLVQDHQRVLVHCVAGRSRSCAVVAGYLRATRGLDPDAALAFVRERRGAGMASPLARLVETMRV